MSREGKRLMHQNICDPKHSQPTCYPQEDMMEALLGKIIVGVGPADHA